MDKRLTCSIYLVCTSKNCLLKQTEKRTIMQNYTIWILCLSIILIGLVLGILSLKAPRYRKGIMGLYVVFQISYLIWRVTGTIPTSSTGDTLFGSLLVLTELLSFTQTAIFILLFWKKGKETKVAEFSEDFIPSVDIFIATYNESSELLQQTLVSAKMVDYPENKRNIYLCDDGHRPEIAELARKWSVGYLTRKDNAGAKAGNLNYAMAHSTSEFVVTMDADMKMKPSFLKEVIPFFKDETMGFVQTPQAFHNPDVLQHNLYVENKVRNDQDFFMRYLQEAKNKFNAVIYVGSNATFRRTAIESVGGFVTDVITEDMATGLLIQNEGWNSEFLNKVLATGLSPETFPELVKQRVRWAKGNVQVFKKYSPRKLKNLSTIQKMLYVDGVHYWFFGIYHFLYLSFPILSILFGIQVINANAAYFLPIWFVSYALSNIVFASVAGRQFRPMWANVAELAIFPYITYGVIQELFFKDTTKFAVTTKGQVVEETTTHWDMMKTQIILLGLSLISILVLTIKLINNPVQTLNHWALPLFWLIYNSLSLIGSLHISVDRPRYKDELMKSHSAGTLSNGSLEYAVKLTKVHVHKAVIILNQSNTQEINKGDRFNLTIQDNVQVPVSVSKINKSRKGNMYSLKIHELDNDTYMLFHQYLDRLNTSAFKNRETNYRQPVYHLTLGYYLKRRQKANAIEY